MDFLQRGIACAGAVVVSCSWRSSHDVHRPSLFITVFPGDDGATWHIHQGNSIKTPLLATVAKTDTFTVKLQMNGTRRHLWINDKYVLSGNFPAESKTASMRYGAYHHGKGVATVHVTNAKFQLDTPAKLSDPTSANGK